MGLVLGLVGTALGAFGPFFVFRPDGVGLLLLWLVPIVLVVGIVLTVKGVHPTYRRGHAAGLGGGAPGVRRDVPLPAEHIGGWMRSAADDEMRAAQ